MWIPEILQIKDFMSIVDGTVEFNQGKATVITGLNEFDDDQDSNGSGKSAILEALSIALRNKPLRPDCSTKDLVRDGSKFSQLKLKLRNSHYNRILEIERIIYPNTKSSELILRIDGVDQKLVSVDHGKEVIFQQLGITENDLINFYLLNKERYKPFFKMSDSEKKEMISRFSQSNLVDPVFDDILKQIEKIEKEISDHTQHVRQIDTKIEVYYEQLVENKDEILRLSSSDNAKEQNDRLATLKRLQSNVEEIIIKTKGDSKAKQKEINQKQKDLDNLPSTEKLEKQLDSLEKLLEEDQQTVEEILTDIANFNKLILKIDKSLVGLVKCPSCDFEFVANDEEIDIKQQKNKRKKAEDQKGECEAELEEVKQDIEQSKKDIEVIKQRIKQQQKKKRSVRQEILDLKEEKQILDEKQTRREKELVQITATISQIKSKTGLDQNQQAVDLLIKQTKKTKELIKTQEQFKILLLDVTQYLSEELELLFQEQSIFLQFKTHLSNKSINALQAYANDYLSKTGSKFQVKLDGYKINRNKAISEKINITVLRDDDESVYGRLSSGEKTRIILSLIIAPQMLINSTCSSGGLDLLFLDEIIESIDSKGISGCLRSLNCIDRTILLVTFGQFNQEYPFITTVHKQPNGIAIIR